MSSPEFDLMTTRNNNEFSSHHQRFVLKKKLYRCSGREKRNIIIKTSHDQFVPILFIREREDSFSFVPIRRGQFSIPRTQTMDFSEFPFDRKNFKRPMEIEFVYVASHSSVPTSHGWGYQTLCHHAWLLIQSRYGVSNPWQERMASHVASWSTSSMQC